MKTYQQFLQLVYFEFDIQYNTSSVRLKIKWQYNKFCPFFKLYY